MEVLNEREVTLQSLFDVIKCVSYPFNLMYMGTGGGKCI